MAMALLGAGELRHRVHAGQDPAGTAEIVAAVNSGKKAFGFTAQHAEQVLPVLLTAILDK